MENIVTFKNVSFTYREAKKPAVNNISFSIKKGSWTSIVGHNGSGKSTISRLINGLLIPDDNPETEIVVDGIKLSDDTVWDIRNNVGIVFQNPDNQFVGATVADDVAFGLENRGIQRDKMIEIVDTVLKEVNMSDYKNSEPSNLSGGQKQRVAIAGILAIEPKIIILDEATSMLDPQGKEHIIELVKRMKQKNDLTVISITHDINEAANSDQVLVINDGNLVTSGSPNEVFIQTKMINEVGLEEPFIFKLQEKLKAVGIDLPPNLDTEEKLVDALCRLNSKM